MRAKAWICCLLVTLVAGISLAPRVSFAQDTEPEKAEISDDQLELNEQGVRAIIGGDYAMAVALLNESLAYGEANVTYLNLGRAYQKQGNCEKARQALKNAKTAPVVAKPRPRIVKKQADKYLAELPEECPEEEEQSADASAKGESEGEIADAEGKEQATQPEKTEESKAPTSEDVQMARKGTTSDDGGSGALGWGAIGGGAALVGTGVVLHFVAEGQRQDIRDADVNEGSDADVIQYDDQQAQEQQQRANLYDTIGLGTGIAGAALVGVGTVLLLTNDSGETTAFRMHVSPGGAMAVAKWTF